MKLSPEEAVALVDKFARDDEVDRLLVEILRSPSPQTERLEADPGVHDFLASIVAPRIDSLTGQP
ncbi:MAG: hypothetical protein IH919_11235, partial [Deltaproteobacteria bacterium]|nr:hypothetical protein [Deltaproteobacteria bacterium]